MRPEEKYALMLNAMPAFRAAIDAVKGVITTPVQTTAVEGFDDTHKVMGRIVGSINARNVSLVLLREGSDDAQEGYSLDPTGNYYEYCAQRPAVSMSSSGFVAYLKEVASATAVIEQAETADAQTQLVQGLDAQLDNVAIDPVLQVPGCCSRLFGGGRASEVARNFLQSGELVILLKGALNPVHLGHMWPCVEMVKSMPEALRDKVRIMLVPEANGYLQYKNKSTPGYERGLLPAAERMGLAKALLADFKNLAGHQGFSPENQRLLQGIARRTMAWGALCGVTPAAPTATS